MSRIGKQPIEVPTGVIVEITSKAVNVKGPKGELSEPIVNGVKVEQKENQIIVTRNSDEKLDRAAHGLMRSLIANMVEGVTGGFNKVLQVQGVGYKINLAGKTLKLNIGYSHEVVFPIPEGIELSVDGMEITVSGADKQQVGQTAALIRKIRKPEPYKGKGIRYKEEYVIQKAGKAASTGGAG